MANQTTLARHALRLRRITLIVAGLIGTFTFLMLAAELAQALGIKPSWVKLSDSSDLPLYLALPIAAVGMGLVIAALLALAEMLACIADGDVFVPTTTRHFRRFAQLLVYSVLWGMVGAVLGRLFATGIISVTVGIDSQGLLGLFLDAVLFFVARLFDEAARIDEDNRSIV